MRLALWTAAALLPLAASLPLAALLRQEPEPAAPASVFAALDGEWEGVFVGYDVEGREQYRIGVRQTYRTVDATTQRVTIEDRLPDGTVVRGRGTNTAERGPDGALRLRCRVEKSNGETVEHDGRLVRGPDGDEELVWYSRAPGRTETFREVVRREGEKSVYSIDGLGQYGDTLMLMHGRYYKLD